MYSKKTTKAAVFLSDRRESKDLGTDLTANVPQMRRLRLAKSRPSGGCLLAQPCGASPRRGVGYCAIATGNREAEIASLCLARNDISLPCTFSRFCLLKLITTIFIYNKKSVLLDIYHARIQPEKKKGVTGMYSMRNVGGHVQVYDFNGKFLFSADTEREAREELRDYEESAA